MGCPPLNQNRCGKPWSTQHLDIIFLGKMGNPSVFFQGTTLPSPGSPPPEEDTFPRDALGLAHVGGSDLAQKGGDS